MDIEKSDWAIRPPRVWMLIRMQIITDATHTSRGRNYRCRLLQPPEGGLCSEDGRVNQKGRMKLDGYSYHTGRPEAPSGARSNPPEAYRKPSLTWCLAHSLFSMCNLRHKREC